MKFFKFFQQFLPKHLWISKNYKIYHIDNPFYVGLCSYSYDMTVFYLKEIGGLDILTPGREMFQTGFNEHAVSITTFLERFHKHEVVEGFKEQYQILYGNQKYKHYIIYFIND